MLALTILRQALQSCGTLLVKGGIDVISGVIAAIDGEKDPRCLLLSFELSQQVVKIYESSPSVPAAQESLQANYEELFDVVACYFPISFTPPPNNVHGITREDLAGALQTTLTCTTLFTPLFIPMLVEKLSSTLRQAKLDALSALAAAAEAYGPDTMQPHLSAIWHALRGELLAPAAPGLLPTDCTSTQQIASKAAECLSKTAKALSQQGDEALAMKVLEDEQMCGDLLACLSGAKQHLSHDPARRVHATTQAIAAVAESSQAACKAACKRLLPNLAAAAATASASLSNSQHYSASRPADQTQRLALSTIFYLLKASNTLTAAGLCHHDPLAGTGSPVFQAVYAEPCPPADKSDTNDLGTGVDDSMDADTAGESVAVQDQSLQQLAEGASHGQGRAQPDSGGVEEDVRLLQLQVMTELVSLPVTSRCLSSQEVSSTVQQLLSCVARSSQSSHEVAQQAIVGLTRMAAAGHTDLLEQGAIDALLDGATETSTAGKWQGALPLQALAALAAPASRLRGRIVSSIQQMLPAMLAASISNQHNQQMLIGVLETVTHKLAPFAQAEEDVAAAMAVDLLTGMRQLTMASKVAAENVAAACAQAVQVATAGCNTQQQALICQTACQQLTQCCQQLQSITPLNLSYADPPSCPAQTGDVTNTSDAESIQRQVQGANEGRQASTTAVDIPSGEAMLPRLHPTEQVTQLLAQSGLVSAAAVAALSPGVLPAPQMKPMLDCLIRLAMGVSQNSIQQAAMTAAAALVNKWPAESSESLREGIVSAVSLLGLSTYRRQTAAGPMQDAATDGAQASSSGRQDHTAVSFTCLSWLIKGICMAGLWTLTGLQLMDIPLSYLSSHQAPASEQPLQASHAVMKTEQGSFPANGGDHTGQAGLGGTSIADEPLQHSATTEQCLQAAAATFELVPSAQDSILPFDRETSHVKVKLLWQQRFYIVALYRLKELLTVCESAGSTDGQQPTDSTDKRQQGPLLLALACLLKGTPAHISKADLPGMVGLLLTALDVLQLPGQCRDKGVLRGALRSVQAVMKESTGRSKLEAEVTRLVATLTSLASYQDADIRILSLQCLVSLMDLPYHLLHPLRKQVVATVMLTVDDNMRRVRQQAVKCLSVWSNGP
ncbi:MAG: MMS19 nucleotide excision repair protein [Trebouxia sp. A1-2]|nr:MAG: MMS19 nucleotide excision repair protein [Trebouxia sp. A1-2]